MATRALSLQPKRPTRNRKPATVTITSAQFERLTVVDQIRRSFRPGARLAGFTGLVIGGFVPLATFTVAHYEAKAEPMLWALVVGGLIYSASTVYQWARDAFGNGFKALGFCVLLEGCMVFAHIPALILTALAVLIFINACAAACALQVRKDVETGFTRGADGLSIISRS